MAVIQERALVEAINTSPNTVGGYFRSVVGLVLASAVCDSLRLLENVIYFEFMNDEYSYTPYQKELDSFDFGACTKLRPTSVNSRTAEGVILTHFRFYSRCFLPKYYDTLTKFLE